ncbi:MAG TPA: redoxin domain-containing protein [Candidatus Acidoferrales bacterium]|jgi:peroxiredoxin|nr:redoxin domain-containing protein [Candidatus Acidoferrales bacterium]
MELEALQQYLPEIQALGATLVAISPQREAFLRQMAEKNHLSFDLLRDEGNVFAGKLGLVFPLPADLREVYSKFGVDLARFNGDDSWTLPMPGRFVVDRHGIVRNADIDPDYTIRPDPSETVANLRKLAGGGAATSTS